MVEKDFSSLYIYIYIIYTVHIEVFARNLEAFLSKVDLGLDSSSHERCQGIEHLCIFYVFG